MIGDIIRMTESARELRHQPSQGVNFAFKFLSLFADLDKLGAVLIDILLKIGGGAVFDLAQVVLVVLNVMFGCVVEKISYI